MQRSTASSAPAALVRTRGALGRRENWLQLIRFCPLSVRAATSSTSPSTLLPKVVGAHYLLAATGSFLVAVTNNYTWNRLDLPRPARPRRLPGAPIPRRLDDRSRGEPRDPGPARRCPRGKVLAQAIAIVLVTPWNFVGNKLWSFGRR